jgi:hypothetical protein
VRWVDDLRSAVLLATAFALAATATVPLLLPWLPPEARSLSLPLPVFCTALAVQLVVMYGLLGFVGIRLARTQGLEPVPGLTAIWNPQAARWRWRRAAVAFAVGLGCGALLVAAVGAIQRFLPETLPGTLHPPGVATALLASTAGFLEGSHRRLLTQCQCNVILTGAEELQKTVFEMELGKDPRISVSPCP